VNFRKKKKSREPREKGETESLDFRPNEGHIRAAPSVSNPEDKSERYKRRVEIRARSKLSSSLRVMKESENKDVPVRTNKKLSRG